MTGTKVFGIESVFDPSRCPLPAPMITGRIALARFLARAGVSLNRLRRTVRGMIVENVSPAAEIVLGFVTDIHFGPPAHFDGKLRKLTHRAGPLLDAALGTLRSAQVHAIVNLGDDIEDENHDADLRRYRECQSRLRASGLRVINVAGNHDTVHLSDSELLSEWGNAHSLHYAFDLGAWRVIVLRTVERTGIETFLPDEQMQWLSGELHAAGRSVAVLMHHSASDQDLSDSRWFSRVPHLGLLRNRAQLRTLFERSGRVRVVFNGHLHRNHIDVINGITYVTLQSLIENLDDDAPGRAAGTHAVARLGASGVVLRVHGNDPLAAQLAWASAGNP